MKQFIDHIVKITEPIFSKWTTQSLDKLDDLFLQRIIEQGVPYSDRLPKFWQVMAEYGFKSIGDFGEVLEKYGEIRHKYDRQKFGGFDATFYQELKQGKAGEKGKMFYKAILECKEKDCQINGRNQWMIYLYLLSQCAYLKVGYSGSFKEFLIAKTGVKDVDALKQLDYEQWNKFLELKPWSEFQGQSQDMLSYLLSDLDLHPDTKEIFVKINSTNRKFIYRTEAFKIIKSYTKKPPRPDAIPRKICVEVLRHLKGDYTLRTINVALYSYCSEASHTLGFCGDKEKCRECFYDKKCPKIGL